MQTQQKTVQIYQMPEIRLITPQPSFKHSESRELRLHSRICKITYKRPQRVKPTLDELFECAAKACYTDSDSIRSRARYRNILTARQIISSYRMTHERTSLRLIGVDFGGKNHATVLNALKEYSKLIDSDRFLINCVDDFKKNLRKINPFFDIKIQKYKE